MNRRLTITGVPLSHSLNYDRISFVYLVTIGQAGKKRSITYFTFFDTINPLNSTLIPYLLSYIFCKAVNIPSGIK
jgi:hypothetical protein